MGIINIGSKGIVSVNGREHILEKKECLYIGMGSKEVSFKSPDRDHPAKFYFNSTLILPYPFVKVSMNDAQRVSLGTPDKSTPAAIRRGYSFKKGEIPSQPLLERLNGALVVTKEFSVILTKDADTQKEIFGLLRGVHDGSLDSDYGSEQGHLHQESHFDWILGTTIYVERQRHLETLLGSRFIDLRWGRPIEYETAVVKAVSNDGGLSEIRQRLSQAMADIIINTASYPKPSLPYLPEFADLAARLRTPVERNTRTNEIYEIPDIELGTRFGQSLMRIARGLLMIGVPVQELRPYLNRMVMDCMSKIRAGVVGCLLKDITKQEDIAHKTNLSRGYVARILEELRLLGVTSEKLKILGDDGVDVEHRGEEI